jgi:crossover junction endodeoxyribonuclease RusA
MIILKGNPKSTQKIYRFSGRIMYMTAEGKAIKEAYGWEAKQQWKNPPIKGEVAVTVVLFFGDKRKRDIDNFNKLILDSLSGIVWDDDVQIVYLSVEKRHDKENPRAEISITEIETCKNIQGFS